MAQAGPEALRVLVIDGSPPDWGASSPLVVAFIQEAHSLSWTDSSASLPKGVIALRKGALQMELLTYDSSLFNVGEPQNLRCDSVHIVLIVYDTSKVDADVELSPDADQIGKCDEFVRKKFGSNTLVVAMGYRMPDARSTPISASTSVQRFLRKETVRRHFFPQIEITSEETFLGAIVKSADIYSNNRTLETNKSGSAKKMHQMFSSGFRNQKRRAKQKILETVGSHVEVTRDDEFSWHHKKFQAFEGTARKALDHLLKYVR